MSPRLQKLYIQFNGICALCNKPVAKRDASVDHIRPKSFGGTNDPSNIQLAHKLCNRQKGRRFQGVSAWATLHCHSITTNDGDHFYVLVCERGKIRAITSDQWAWKTGDWWDESLVYWKRIGYTHHDIGYGVNPNIETWKRNDKQYSAGKTRHRDESS